MHLVPTERRDRDDLVRRLREYAERHRPTLDPDSPDFPLELARGIGLAVGASLAEATTLAVTQDPRRRATRDLEAHQPVPEHRNWGLH